MPLNKLIPQMMTMKAHESNDIVPKIETKLLANLSRFWFFSFIQSRLTKLVFHLGIFGSHVWHNIIDTQTSARMINIIPFMSLWLIHFWWWWWWWVCIYICFMWRKLYARMKMNVNAISFSHDFRFCYYLMLSKRWKWWYAYTVVMLTRFGSTTVYKTCIIWSTVFGFLILIAIYIASSDVKRGIKKVTNSESDKKKKTETKIEREWERKFHFILDMTWI